MKFITANKVLWLAFALALLSSLSHLAWAFGTLEFGGWHLTGWLPAIAVDAGLAALAYGIQQRKRARRGTLALWGGVAVFAAISAFANLLHALAVTNGYIVTATIASIDALEFAKAAALSASLPLLVVYLGEIVSSDDAEAAQAAERERARVERIRARSEQVASIADAPATQVAPVRTYQCAQCDLVFDKSQRLAAHVRHTHRDGREAAKAVAMEGGR